MANVLTIAPAFFPMSDDWLRGEYWAPGSGNTRIVVPQHNLDPIGQFDLDVIAEDVNTIVQYMNAQSEPYWIVAHSRGSQLFAKACRDILWTQAAQLAAPPALLKAAVLTGNLERKYNGEPGGGDYPGLDDQPPGGRYPADPGGSGMPLNTPYRVIDFARQYDRFADQPDDRSIAIAVRNNAKGGGVHMNYTKVHPNDPGNYWVTEGKISYVVSPSFPVNTVKALPWRRAEIARQDDLDRPQIELAYHRPRAAQPTTLTPAPPVQSTLGQQVCPGSGQPSATTPRAAMAGLTRRGTCSVCRRTVAMKAFTPNQISYHQI